MSGSATRAAVSPSRVWVAALAGALAAHAWASPARASEPPAEAGGFVEVTASAAAPVDSAEGLPIRGVTIVPRTVFEPVPPGRLGPIYRLVNRMHVRTRPGTLREQLLFAPGGPWSHERGHETERNLRALDFLNPSPIVATVRADSVDVRVETRDTWSTRPEFDLESFEGRAYGSIAFTERNLLGYGKSLAFTYREVPTGISRSFSYEDPGVAGSRTKLRYAASDGSLGASDLFEVGVPFYALDTPYAFQISRARASSIASLFQRTESVATFDREVERFEAWWGNGWRDGETIRRLKWTFRAADRRFGPSTLEPGAPPEFDGPREVLRLRQLAVEGRIWRPRYIERTNVDRMDLIEDFEVGPSFGVTLGAAPRALGSTAGETFGGARLDLGAETPYGFGWVRTDVSSRVRGGPVETIERVDARWVGQSERRHALVLSALGIRGSRTPRDFQVMVGGLSGLRSYPVQALAGTRLWRLNAEQRWTVKQNAWQVVSLGAVAFADAARAWGPGATGTDWFVSSGAGLRLALPQWSLGSLIRLDVGWPISPTRDGHRRPILSIGSSQAF